MEELEKLKEEGEEHKLHDYYTVTRAFQRYVGVSLGVDNTVPPPHVFAAVFADLMDC